LLRLSHNRSRLIAIVVLMFGMLSITTSALPVRADSTMTTTTVHKKNWVQRHPTMTAIGAAVVTHHALKVAARNAKLHGKKLNWAERHPTLSAIGVGVATHHIIKKTTPHDAQ
jgi:hypothetical protein